MRFCLWFVLGWASSISCLGQGEVNFANRVPGVVVAPFYGVEPCPCETWSITGNPANGLPPECRVYRGALLNGTGFTAALYAASVEQPDNFYMVATTTFRTGSAAGLIISRTVNIPGLRPGERAIFQVRTWDNYGGTITSWDQALAHGVAIGLSEKFSPAEPLGGVDSLGERHPILNLTALRSFNLFLTGSSAQCEPLCQPRDQTVGEGANVEFCFEICGSTCDYQWYFEGYAISGATNRILFLRDVRGEDTGEYFCVADGTVNSTRARLAISGVALRLRSPRWTGPGAFAFDLHGPSNRVYSIESTSNLQDWTEIGKVTNTFGITTFQDRPASGRGGFYRARPVP